MSCVKFLVSLLLKITKLRGGREGGRESLSNFFRAVEGEHMSCVKCLVSYGALILKNCQGYTPIDISHQKGFQAIITYFNSYPVCELRLTIGNYFQ
jgi:hypothetical protein